MYVCICVLVSLCAWQEGGNACDDKRVCQVQSLSIRQVGHALGRLVAGNICSRYIQTVILTGHLLV